MIESEKISQDQNLEEEFNKNTHLFKKTWKYAEELSIWNQFGAAATAAEFAFAKQPFIAVPAIYVDVASGLGGIFQKTSEGTVQIGDFISFGSSLASFAGGYAMLASIGIEKTAVGLRLITFAEAATPIGFGLVALGTAIDNYPIIVTKFNELKNELQTNTAALLPQDSESQKFVIEDSQFHLDVQLSYGFRPPKSQALYRVDGVLGSSLKINILASGIKDLEDEQIWEKSELKNDSTLLKNFNILEPENYEIFSLKENQNVSILKTQEQFVGIKDSEPFHFQFPILKKENKILAISEILENNEGQNNRLFHVEASSEAPYCGDIIKQRNGDSLLYVCIVANKTDPTSEQIEQYITQRFNNEW